MCFPAELLQCGNCSYLTRGVPTSDRITHEVPMTGYSPTKAFTLRTSMLSKNFVIFYQLELALCCPVSTWTSISTCKILVSVLHRVCDFSIMSRSTLLQGPEAIRSIVWACILYTSENSPNYNRKHTHTQPTWLLNIINDLSRDGLIHILYSGCRGKNHGK